MWNVYNATKEGYSQTNNVSEGFYSKLKNIVRIKDPNLYIFIESIHNMCNASVTTALVQKQNEIINVSKILSFKEKKLQSFCTTFKI